MVKRTAMDKQLRFFFTMFSISESILKVALAGRNHSLVAHTSKCGWVISHHTKLHSIEPIN
jgi:hypothetical protein